MRRAWVLYRAQSIILLWKMSWSWGLHSAAGAQKLLFPWREGRSLLISDCPPQPDSDDSSQDLSEAPVRPAQTISALSFGHQWWMCACSNTGLLDLDTVSTVTRSSFKVNIVRCLQTSPAHCCWFPPTSCQCTLSTHVVIKKALVIAKCPLVRENYAQFRPWLLLSQCSVSGHGKSNDGGQSMAQRSKLIC